ncbi:MAG TPA: hypothetical protein VGN72_01140 [Tepidisphaeraceae bacterium]|jgi:acyl-CoA synthetase (NDP forming)|nr:hypothetical protein [Tepidisphaeraceae bacterium]
MDIAYYSPRMDVDKNIREVAGQRRVNLLLCLVAGGIGIAAFVSWYKFAISLHMMYVFVAGAVALVILSWINERRLWQSISERRSHGFAVETKGKDA